MHDKTKAKSQWDWSSGKTRRETSWRLVWMHPSNPILSEQKYVAPLSCMDSAHCLLVK